MVARLKSDQPTKKSFRLKLILQVGVLLLLLAWSLVTKAQPPDLLTTLVGVESHHFPEVKVALTVSDATGFVENLTPDKVAVFEETPETPVASFTLEPSELSHLRLAVIVDTSLPAEDLTQAQAGVTALFKQLAPSDKAALFSVGDKVKPEYGLTNNVTELTAAVNRLTAGGSKTALNQAIIDAAIMLDYLLEGRRAIVVITNSQNDVAGPTLEHVTTAFQKARLPLFVLDFGATVKDQNPPLKAEVPRTGGEYLSLTGADQIEAELLALQKRLRQGYLLTFQSGLSADSYEHNVYVRVNTAAGQGEAIGQFVAEPAPVAVNFVNLMAGQTVAGQVTLSVQATAPAPLTAVHYRLDDQPLGEVAAAPYTFEWNTTVLQPGPHRLVAEAIDQTGNRGQAELMLRVAPPTEVELSAAKQEFEIGQPAGFGVQIKTIAEIDKIVYRIDDKVLATLTEPPYSFTFDNQAYAPGVYNLTVTVYDSFGVATEDSLAITLLPAAPPPPSWLKRTLQSPTVQLGLTLAAALGAILTSVGLAYLALRFTASFQRNQVKRQGRLEIVNAGNIQSCYGLQVLEFSRNLDFQFRVNGTRLARFSPTEPARGNAGPSGQTASAAEALRPGPVGTVGGGSDRHPATPATKDWVQTPPIQPGQSLLVDFLITPRKLHQTQTYTFQIASQALEVDWAPVVKDQGVVKINGLPWAWRYGPSFIVGLIVFGLVALILMRVFAALSTIELASLLQTISLWAVG